MLEGALEGRVAIVTGAGRGIGRALALALAEAGADVALAARSNGEISKVSAEVENRGRWALAIPTDVTDEAEVEGLVGRVLEELGGLDVLVNNSGVIHSAPLTETSPEEWDRVVGTNLRGTFLCMRAAGRHFLERGEGKVVNVASNFAFMGVPRFAAYCASKAGVVNLTRELAVQWARRGIRVNAIAPGWFASEMTEEMFADESSQRFMRRNTPMGRTGEGHELDGALLFLASDASSYVTGHVLTVDGGWTAQ